MDFSSSRFACHVVDDIVIGVHTDEPPDDTDWSAWIDASRRALDGFGIVRGLVYSMGGNPTSKQRSEINDLFRDRPQRVAVMLDSRIARGAVTALSWFNPQIKAFDHTQFDDACMHLGIRGDQRERTRRALEDMKAILRV